MDFVRFTPGKGANRQKLPPEKKPVIVLMKNTDPRFPNPLVVGYLKYHAGVKSQPYFVTPGCTFGGEVFGDDSAIAWCDCLPHDFMKTWQSIPEELKSLKE